MNDHRRSKDFCYYHPKQRLHGVCPFCLNDKLLVVAAEQSRREPSHRRRPSKTADLPKISACAPLLTRRRTYHRRQCGVDGGGGGSDSESTSPSAQETFISIKFEGNGVGKWDNAKVSKDQPTFTNPKEGCAKMLVEHLRMPRGLLRWRKRIGRLLQLAARWKPHADAFGGVKITRRRNCKP